MKKQFISFLYAIMIYTRIPVLFKLDYDNESLGNATVFLPLIGWIVGAASALVFYGSVFILPVSVSVFLAMATSILITGAFHEDGFADVCDGFGGGSTKEKKLEIMKDSHIGAYGVIGLIMILGFKFLLLNEMNVKMIPFVIIAANSLSRLAAVIMMNSLSYVRKIEESKVVSFIKKMSVSQLIIACLFGVLPLILFQNYLFYLLILPLLLVTGLLGIYFKKHIGGYTGDCLGATQQLCEVTFYLFFLILL